jgi:hypothetical protein
MPLKKPSQLFEDERVFISEEFDQNSVLGDFTETFDRFKDNVSLIEDLKEKVNFLTEEINQKITKNDLENAIFSHLIIVDENIKNIKSKIKGINDGDLNEFKEKASTLEEIVADLTGSEIPKYKKKVVETELRISEKFGKFKTEIEAIHEDTQHNIEEKIKVFADTVDNNFSIFNQTLQETKQNVSEIVNTYKKLYKIIENKGQKENKKLEEYSKILEDFNLSFLQFQENIENRIGQYQKINDVIDEKLISFKEGITVWENNAINNINDFKSQIKNDVFDFKEDISSLKSDIVVFETHNKSLQNFSDNIKENFLNFEKKISELDKVQKLQKNLTEELDKTKKDLQVVERYIQNHHGEIIELKEEVFNYIKELSLENVEENIHKLNQKLDYIEKVYNNIEPDVIVKEVIQEGLVNEPPSVKNNDSLTPLEQNFVTLEQLQQHYRLFINRIQQQLSTLGGGGETQLKYLDDIVGIATNASAYDGKFLKYNHSLKKFEFSAVDTSFDSWGEGINGPYTNGNVGIGTSVANSELDVVGNVYVSGIVTATTFSGNLQNTLTLNTSGIGLSGDTTFNNSGASTFTVTSNATSANTNNTIVARNGAGGFVAGIVTAIFVGNLTGNLNSSGVNTATTISGTTINYNIGTITHLNGTNVSYSGIGTVGSLNIGSTQVISSERQLQNIASLDATTTATIENAIANAPNTFTDLNITGFSTLTRASATSLVVSGVTTSTGGFVGALSGTATSTTNIPNLSGDVSSVNTVTTLATVNSNVGTFGSAGAIPVVIVNGKGLVTGISTVAVPNGALTLNVSGTGLSGSASFTANQAGASTFTVTSNATSDNTTSTIVARNGAGGFSAGVVTATTFSGNLQNTLTLNTSGTGLSGSATFNNSGVSTFTVTSNATSVNTNSTIVSRDGSGNFSAGTITANLSGNINSVGVNTVGSLNIGVDVGISTTRTTVATVSATTIDSFSTSIFRSARVQIQITQGTNYQTSDVLIIHNGTTADVVEYGSIATNDYLGTFSSTVSGGNCLLQINMNSATSATVKVLSQRITV